MTHKLSERMSLVANRLTPKATALAIEALSEFAIEVSAMEGALEDAMARLSKHEAAPIVGWAVRDYSGDWILFRNESVARMEAEETGALMCPLVARPGDSQ